MFKPLADVIARLESASRVLVIGHIKPDGDDISSVASLVLILRKLGKSAEGCIADEIPWFYTDIPGVSLIKNVNDLRGYRYDTAVTVDASDLSRIGNAATLLAGRRPDITIDHHKTNTGFGDINFCDPGYAAVAMIIYEIGRDRVEYDPTLAEVTLLGIATDTGFFKYGSTDYKVFSYAAELVKKGANIQRIASAVLEHTTINEIKLMVEMFNTLTLDMDGKLAWAYISTETLLRTNCTEQDTEGLVGEIRSIHGVEVAILFIEWPKNHVHISFRSKSYADVSEIALKFGGGGHARAAGCSCKNVELHTLIDRVISAARQTLAA